MLKNELSIRFEIKNFGEVGCFLGLEIEDLDEGYFVSQRRYAKELVQRFDYAVEIECDNESALIMLKYIYWNKIIFTPIIMFTYSSEHNYFS